VMDRKAHSKKSPERFDIVICPLPRKLDSLTAPRVVGLAGETVQLSGDKLLLNSNAISLAPYLAKSTITNLDPWGTFGVNRPACIPPGCVFVLGDNAAAANDSRFFGPLPLNLVVGQVKR